MTITPNGFAAYLKCTTKCWLRAVSENPTGNAYAEWIQDQNESYRAAGLKRLLSAVPQHQHAIAPAAGEMKTAKWRLAVDVPVRTEEFPSLDPQPKWTVESRLQAVERVPSEGRANRLSSFPFASSSPTNSARTTSFWWRSMP